MKSAVAKGLLTVAAYLPLSLSQAIGVGLGHLAWKLHEKSRHISLTNLRVCFPEQPEGWREEVGRKSLIAMSQAMLEAPSLWRLNKDELNGLVLNPEALEPVLNAYEAGEGLVLASPHLGSWEFVGLITGQRMKMTSLFRPPRMEELGEFIRQGRQNSGATLVPTDSSGVKALTRALKNGEATGILPDQEPPQGAGVFADFFGQPAYTMPLILKLAKKRRIPIFFLYAERRKKGFHLHVTEGSDALYQDRIEDACATMNAQIEQLVRQHPEQYNWNYKRFRHQPDGTDLYRRS